MALKGLDIFKLSPKKNCKECGCPTCMAFSMKVAQGAVDIAACPYFAPEALAKLSAAHRAANENDQSWCRRCRAVFGRRNRSVPS